MFLLIAIGFLIAISCSTFFLGFCFPFFVFWIFVYASKVTVFFGFIWFNWLNRKLFGEHLFRLFREVRFKWAEIIAGMRQATLMNMDRKSGGRFHPPPTRIYTFNPTEAIFLCRVQLTESKQTQLPTKRCFSIGSFRGTRPPWFAIT